MTDLLPVGAYVRVTPQPLKLLGGMAMDAERPYVGKVRGHDLGHTKYQISERVRGWDKWLFAEGGRWEFVSDVQEIAEDEALRADV
jgi:hypothetical protein